MSRTALLRAAFVAAMLAVTTADVRALTCYTVFDRSENVIYRDVYPPIDLSDAGAAERDAMRGRGEFLMFMESEQCPRLEFFTGSAGTVGVRLEQIVAPASETPREPVKPSAPRAPRKPAPRAG